MHKVNRRIAALTIGLATASALTITASAQDWPQRTVHMLVPLPPGTAIDVSARLIAEQLSARWKQPVVVENVAGADGVLAAKEFVGRRDDHTLLYSFAGLITINPLLYEKLPYDPRDLAPIATTSDNFLVIAASPKLKIGSLAELLKRAQASSTKFNWAATSGIPYFAFAGFAKSAGVDMVYVPYRDFRVHKLKSSTEQNESALPPKAVVTPRPFDLQRSDPPSELVWMFSSLGRCYESQPLPYFPVQSLLPEAVH